MSWSQFCEFIPDVNPVICVWQRFLIHSSSLYSRLWNVSKKVAENCSFFPTCKNQVHQIDVAPEGIATRSWVSDTPSPISIVVQYSLFFVQITPLAVWSHGAACECASPLQRACHGRFRRSSSRTSCSARELSLSAAQSWKWVFDLPDSFWQLTLIPSGSMELSAVH